MSERLPVRVNPFRLAAQGRELCGVVELSAAARLREALADAPGAARVRFAFTVDESGRPRVEGEISAELSLLCQRCLEPVELPVTARVQAVLVATDAEAGRLQGQCDAVLVEGESLTLLDLVEDELLLALPLVPMHASLEACSPAAREVLSASEHATAAEEERSSPFAVLKTMKSN